MSEKESKPSAEDNIVINELTKLIEKDAHTQSLTVAQLALSELAKGQINSALLSLRIDRDKLLSSNRELYDYLTALLKERGLPN